MKKIEMILIGAISLMSTTASAGIMIFDNRAAFIAATGATGIGAIPGSSSSAGFSLGGLNFINEPNSSLNRSRNWSTVISEAFDLAVNDVEQFNIESAALIFSLGFDFHEPIATTPPGPTDPDTCNTAACVASTFEVTLLNGAVVVGAFSFASPVPNADNLLLQFVGVDSSDPFNRVEVRETVGTADNEFFGNFLTSRTPVPEPTSLALLGLGLAGLGFARKKLH